jgi:hypothetical protein
MTYEPMTHAELQALSRQWGLMNVLLPQESPSLSSELPVEEGSFSTAIGLPHHRQVPVINRRTLGIWIGAAVVMLVFWTVVWKLCWMVMR